MLVIPWMRWRHRNGLHRLNANHACDRLPPKKAPPATRIVLAGEGHSLVPRFLRLNELKPQAYTCHLSAPLSQTLWPSSRIPPRFTSHERRRRPQQ